MHIYVLPPTHLLLVLRKHHEQAGIFVGTDVSAIRGASPFWPHGTAVCAGTLARLAATGGPSAFSQKTLPAVVREVLKNKVAKEIGEAWKN